MPTDKWHQNNEKIIQTSSNFGIDQSPQLLSSTESDYHSSCEESDDNEDSIEQQTIQENPGKMENKSRELMYLGEHS